MKKLIVILIAVLGVALVTQAQEKEDFTSDRGVYMMPESGDIGLGFNAIPFLNYVGNAFNGTAGNSISVNFINNQAIVGKYYLSDDAAARGELRIGYLNNKNAEFIQKDQDIPDPDVLVEDVEKTGITNVHVGAGYEMRRGHGRLQGYYGGMLMLNYFASNARYDYGNPITGDFNSPNTTNFGGNLTTDGRVTESYNQSMGAGLRGFIGVEYFFLPKISIGGEFGWGFNYNFMLKSQETAEMWNGTEIETNTTEQAKDATFNLDTDNNYMGSIFMIFHF
ncbi:MAG: hypothetical protein PF590_02220 [Candidatus Delongbacteria bacterium]|jgi:hypothetical protein|nr:hypothetical protein [Candidatus Delongbacteria bacterium]